MRVLVNKEDNSVAMLEKGNFIIPSVLENDPSLSIEEFDGSCLDGIPEDEYPNLFWSPDSRILYIHPEIISLDTPSGKTVMRERVQTYSLIPPSARTEGQNLDIEMARRTLGEDEVETLLTDGVLEDDEIAAILGALDDD